jgi:hypothetical protein
MKLTLAGDSNLDGRVDFTDLVALAQNYNAPDTGYFWDEGDFNYDHKVDFNDLVLLAQNYNATFVPAVAIPGAPAGFSEDFARAFAPDVPEPSVMVSLTAVCSLVVLPRRVCRKGRVAPRSYLPDRSLSNRSERCQSCHVPAAVPSRFGHG